MKKLAVLILNWNSDFDTIECVSSVKKYVQSNDILVVDNKSTDDSYANIKKIHPDINYIQATDNNGYAAGNNIGLRHFFQIGYDYVLILNNDTRLVCNIAINNIVNCNYNDIGIFGLRLQEISDAHIHKYRFTTYDFFGILFKLISKKISIKNYNNFSCVNRVSGAALIIEKNFYNEVGGMNENYFLYCEEIDYCFKAYMSGWYVVYDNSNKISVIHNRKSNNIRPYVFYYTFRNMILFCKFNFKLYNRYAALILCYIAQLKIIIKLISKMKFRIIRIAIIGIIDGLSNKSGKNINNLKC